MNQPPLTPISLVRRLAVDSRQQREQAAQLAHANLQWVERWPTRFFIVHREHEQESLLDPLRRLVGWLLKASPGASQGVKVHVNAWLYDQLMPCEGLLQHGDWSFPSEVDLVITLGGDGTVLNAAWQFQRGQCPPLLPFHFGTLGFLTAFGWDHPVPAEVLLEGLIRRGARLTNRLRLQCKFQSANEEVFECQVLNEVVIDRGPQANLIQIELWHEQGRLALIHADGLILATPTGSTAYSLSAGGALCHPDVPAYLITPICPHTLTLRPLLLPDWMEVRVQLAPEARSNAWISWDGRARHELSPGDQLTVGVSLYSVPTIAAQDQTMDWFYALSRCLHWNERSIIPKP